MDDQGAKSLRDILGNDRLDFLTEGGAPQPEAIGGTGGEKATNQRPSVDVSATAQITDAQRAAGVQRDEAALATAREALAYETTTPEQQANLAGHWDQNARLGRLALRAISDREQARYSLQYDPRGFDRQDIRTIREKPTERPLTAADVAEARRASYAIALQIAVQTNETQVPRSAGLREDADSLDEVGKVVRSGMNLARDLAVAPNGERDVVLNEARKVIAQRMKQPVDRITSTDKQLLDWTAQQFTGAHTRLVRTAAAVRGVHAR